jgi:hypothetical protein
MTAVSALTPNDYRRYYMARPFFYNRDERSRSRTFILSALLIATCLLALSFAFAGEQNSLDIHKEIIERKVQRALTFLYDAEPGARAVLESFSGYAVFTTYGSERGPATGEIGRGIAFNNKTGERTFMNVLPFETQPAKPLKYFRFIFAFSTNEAFDRFIDGRFQVNGEKDLPPQSAGIVTIPVGAVFIEPAIFLYQLTDDGLTTELIAKHTKYYRNNKLN